MLRDMIRRARLARSRTGLCNDIGLFLHSRSSGALVDGRIGVERGRVRTCSGLGGADDLVRLGLHTVALAFVVSRGLSDCDLWTKDTSLCLHTSTLTIVVAVQ